MVGDLTLADALRRNARYFAAKCGCGVVAMRAVAFGMEGRHGFDGLLASLAYDGWVMVGDKIWCPACWREMVTLAARDLASAKRRRADPDTVAALHKGWRSMIEAERAMRQRCKISIEVMEPS